MKTALLAVLLVCFSWRTATAQTHPPTDWLDADVGGGSGSWTAGDDGLVVEGQGADVWGPADAFHFTYQALPGDGEFRARVVSVTGAQPWTKVGLMIRQDPDDPSSPHHYLLASESRGLAYQRRLIEGGTSLSTGLGFIDAPAWFRIVRSGAQVQLAWSTDGVNWKDVATVSWPTGTTYVGLAVTSHDPARRAEGAFDHVGLTGTGRSAPAVTIQQPLAGDTLQAGQPYTIRWLASDPDDDLARFDIYQATESEGTGLLYELVAGCMGLPASARACTWQNPGPPDDFTHLLVVGTDSFNDEGRNDVGPFTITDVPGALPSGWTNHDIGAVAASGTATFDGTTFTVRGSGADIWGTADEFQYVHRTISGDFTITARVASVESMSQWTKAGLMIREGLSPGARHVSIFATPSSVKGVAFQRRLVEDGTSTHTSGPAFAPPVWIKLMRSSWAVNAYYRHAITDPWTFLGREVLDNLSDTLEVGFAVSSHVDGRLATARFTNLSIEPVRPWGGVSIGTSQGTAGWDGQIFSLGGQGSDIWGVADAFFYTAVPWTGDGTMVARVTSIEPSHAWAKAGVMFRESFATNSKHVFALLSAGHGAALQYRPTTGGQSASAGSRAGGAPGWLRLTRAGNTFTAELSIDGVTWTTIGSVTVPMAQTIYVGIAHTSHNGDDAGGARFDDLSIRR